MQIHMHRHIKEYKYVDRLFHQKPIIRWFLILHTHNTHTKPTTHMHTYTHTHTHTHAHTNSHTHTHTQTHTHTYTNSHTCTHTRYPSARAEKRRLVYHAGPTNSGKTYHALKHFLSAEYAIYCAPLRMLAHEIFQKSNKQVLTPLEGALSEGSRVSDR